MMILIVFSHAIYLLILLTLRKIYTILFFKSIKQSNGSINGETTL